MRLLVFGATGGTGRALIDQASQAGHEVSAFVRRPEALAGALARPIAGDALDPEAVAAAVPGHDAVLSALGTRPWRHQDICSGGMACIVPAMQRAGIRRVIALSSQGVGDSRLGRAAQLVTRLALRKSFADKLAMETSLATTELDWVVVRPGLLTNGQARGTWRAADDTTLRGGLIGRADVAAFMLAQLESDTWLRRRPVIVW